MNTTQPACSSHRQSVPAGAPYMDSGHAAPRTTWSSAVTADATNSTRQSR